MTPETGLVTATEASYAVACPTFRLKKTGSFQWPLYRAMSSIILCVSHLLLREIIPQTNSFQGFLYFEPVKIHNNGFLYAFSDLFFPQLLIVYTLPKCKAAPHAFDKTENFGALWDKFRGHSPVLAREVPTSQRTSINLALSDKCSRKVQLWLTHLKNICSCWCRNGQLVWYVLPIWRQNLSDLGAVIVLGCMAALLRYCALPDLAWLRCQSASLP